MSVRPRDIAKLVFGRVVVAVGIKDSTGSIDTKPHLAVVLDDKIDDVRTNRSVMVAVITTYVMPGMEAFLEPIPARLQFEGLRGNVACHWIPDPVDLSNVNLTDHVFFDDEMQRVMRRVDAFLASQN